MPSPDTTVRQQPLNRCHCRPDCLASISATDNTTTVNGALVLVDHLHRVDAQ